MSIEMLLGEPFTWSMPLLAGLLAVSFMYVFLLRSPTSPIKPILFFTGLLMVYFLIGSPLTLMTKLSFSFHMIQMGILYFIVPPLLLLGIPQSVLKQVRTTFKHIVRVRIPFSSTHALYLFSILLLIYHVPFIFIIFTQHAFAQTAYEVVLFSLAVWMWWPIASPNPSERLKDASLKKYVFKSGLLITPACLYFIFTAFIDASHSPFLTQLTAHICIPEASSISSPFHTKSDQFFAGVSMFGLHKVGLIVTSKLKMESK